MKKVRAWLLLLCALSSCPNPVSGAEKIYEYEVTSYHIDIQVHEDNSYDTIEKIDVLFTVPSMVSTVASH